MKKCFMMMIYMKQVMDDDENEGISNKTTDENNDEKIDDANYRD